MGKRTFPGRRLRLDLERYRELKLKILERDGWKCRRCSRRDQLQIQHLVRRLQAAKLPLNYARRAETGYKA